MARQPIEIAGFPYVPVNKFHAAAQARYVAAQETREAIEALTLSQPDRAVIEGATRGIEQAVIYVAKALETRHGDDFKPELARIAAAIENLGRREADNVTALYAAAIDVTGEIVKEIPPGEWLLTSQKSRDATLGTIAAASRKRQNERERQAFVDTLLRTAPNFQGLPTRMIPDEIGRFFDLAPAVWASICESQRPVPPTIPAPPPQSPKS